MSSQDVSDDVWIVPQVGTLPTAEFRKLRRMLHELGRRNIYMRYKYIGRLYHAGVLEQMVELLNKTSEKRKRSEDESLPEPKRKSADETEEDDSALTDYDSNQGDSSDEAEDEEEEEEEVDNYGNEQLAKEEKEHESNFKDTIFPALRYCRRNVSTQTDGPIYLD